jgi:hypothetical protein
MVVDPLRALLLSSAFAFFAICLQGCGSSVMAGEVEEIVVAAGCKQAISNEIDGVMNSTSARFSAVCNIPAQLLHLDQSSCASMSSSLMQCGRETVLDAYGTKCMNDTITDLTYDHIMENTSNKDWATEWAARNRVSMQVNSAMYMGLLAADAPQAIADSNVTGLCASAKARVPFPTISEYALARNMQLRGRGARAKDMAPALLGCSLAAIVLGAAGASFYRAHRRAALASRPDDALDAGAAGGEVALMLRGAH